MVILRHCQKIFFMFRPSNGLWKNEVMFGHYFYCEEDFSF